MAKALDLTGERIGRWTVLERFSWGRTSYRCLCDCGTQKMVRQDGLRSGESQSCGCLHKERAREFNLTRNRRHDA